MKHIVKIYWRDNNGLLAHSRMHVGALISDTTSANNILSVLSPLSNAVPVRLESWRVQHYAITPGASDVSTHVLIVAGIAGDPVASITVPSPVDAISFAASTTGMVQIDLLPADIVGSVLDVLRIAYGYGSDLELLSAGIWQ